MRAYPLVFPALTIGVLLLGLLAGNSGIVAAAFVLCAVGAAVPLLRTPDESASLIAPLFALLSAGWLFLSKQGNEPYITARTYIIPAGNGAYATVAATVCALGAGLLIGNGFPQGVAQAREAQRRKPKRDELDFDFDDDPPRGRAPRRSRGSARAYFFSLVLLALGLAPHFYPLPELLEQLCVPALLCAMANCSLPGGFILIAGVLAAGTQVPAIFANLMLWSFAAACFGCARCKGASGLVLIMLPVLAAILVFANARPELFDTAQLAEALRTGIVPAEPYWLALLFGKFGYAGAIVAGILAGAALYLAGMIAAGRVPGAAAAMLACGLLCSWLFTAEAPSKEQMIFAAGVYILVSALSLTRRRPAPVQSPKRKRRRR